MNQKKLNRILTVCCVIGVLGLTTYFTVKYTTYKRIQAEEKKANSKAKTDQLVNKSKATDESGKPLPYTSSSPSHNNEIEVTNEIHWMANTKIIAKDGRIEGLMDMTPDNIKKCKNLLEANKVEFGDDEYKRMEAIKAK